MHHHHKLKKKKNCEVFYILTSVYIKNLNKKLKI